MPPDTVVNNQPPAEPTAAPAQPPATPPGTITREEFDALKEKLAEQERTTQFWYDRANGRAGRQSSDDDGESNKPAKNDEPDVDLLDLITTRGAKGFEEYMRSKGFVTREEAENLIGSKAGELEVQGALYEEYPDLKKKTSDFFKATAIEYGELVKTGVPNAIAMVQAARNTELRFLKEGKIKTPAAKADEDKATREAERKERAKAAMGDRGSRTAGDGGEPEDDELTDEQKRIARAMGVSEEAYKKRAKAGVQMSAKIAAR